MVLSGLVEYAGPASAANELIFISIYILTVLYLPRNATVLRLLSLASLAGVSWTLGIFLMRLTSVPQWRATMTTFCGIQLLNASEILCVFRVDSVSVSHAPQVKQPISLSNGTATGAMKSQRQQWQKPGTMALVSKTISLLWNLRRVGTQWEIKEIAPTRVESRPRFLLRRIFLTFLAYLVYEALCLSPPPKPALIAAGKETLIRWRRLSAEDLTFRIGATIGMGLSVSMLNTILTNVANITLVAVGASRPSECPTLNGSIMEAYTIRKFWGSVWQQGLQRPLAGHANAIVNTVLPRGTLLSQMSRLFLAFFISGLIHLATDVGLGVRIDESGAVSFFCLQSVGIMVEEVAQQLIPVKRLPTLLRTLIGYLWVLAFMSWSVPVWLYPHLRLGMDAADMVPVKFLTPVIRGLTYR